MWRKRLSVLLFCRGLIIATVFCLAHLVSTQENPENPKQCSPSSLRVINTWACFSVSAYVPLASKLPTNQLQIVLHLFLVCHWAGSSVPWWHPQDLRPFQIASFLLWHLSVSNPFCQNKVIWPTFFCISRSQSWTNSHTTLGMLLTSTLFQSCSEHWTFPSTKGTCHFSFKELGYGR